mgnify:CR=1 FL=1
MSIEAKNLSKQYGAQLAVNAISFNAQEGQIVGFLGPNGAGKSTMMKILTGFLKPTAGAVFIDEINVLENPLDAQKIIGYLPEHNPLYEEMFVREYLQFQASIFKVDKSQVDDCIVQVGLTSEAHKKIHQLSKGYKQRVGIAQAIIHNPEVLILDEPTSGLDPNQLDEIRKLILKIGKEKTVLLSTHIMQEVEAMCDRVIIINKGGIVADNLTSNMRKMGIKEAIVVVEFSNKINLDELKKISNVQRIEQGNTNDYKLFLKDSNLDIRHEIFQMAVSHGWSILAMQMEERDLEGVFKELTNK